MEPSQEASTRHPPNGNPPTPIAEGFALGGVSDLPDPLTHAYRKDLADAALAGRVIASHYAEPLSRTLIADAPLHPDADEASDPLQTLRSGSVLKMLDCSRGWAWGYAPDGRVGYIRAAAIGA